MDVDRTYMSNDEREKLMRSGSCFRCKKQGHMIADCPSKPSKSTIQEATVETPKKGKKKDKDQEDKSPDPPSYDSLLKQINACSMEDCQKLMEVFSNDGSEEDF